MPKKPTIYAIAGGPAAGKTTFVAQSLHNNLLPTSAFLHDCDAVMVSLPGYQKQLATEHDPAKAWADWQLIAREIAEQQLAEKIAAKEDVIYDRSCALENSLTFLKDLVENQGYSLKMYVLYVPLAVAHDRATKREIDSQRHVPPKIITERHVIISQLWLDYMQLATEAYILDNTDAVATTIAIYKDKKLEILNPLLYEAFISLGKKVVQQEPDNTASESSKLKSVVT